MKRKLLRSLIGVLLVAGVASAYGMLRLRSVPAAALQCLRAPRQMTLYSIDPNFGALIEQPTAPSFHRYRVLGQTAVLAPREQRAVANTIECSIIRSFGLEAGCFNPRHAVRVSDASGTYDFLICFEREQIEMYAGEKPVGHVAVLGWGTPLDEILSSAHVPSSPR